MTFKETFENIVETANKNTKAVAIRARYGSFCPYLQFITYDALKKEDWPNHIEMNSISLTFEVHMDEKKVELHSFGHVYLSEKDKKSEQFKYLAMRSIIEVAAIDYGVKKFRKQKYKDIDDLCSKMEAYYNAVMNALIQYTGGYPYKKGIAE